MGRGGGGGGVASLLTTLHQLYSLGDIQLLHIYTEFENNILVRGVIMKNVVILFIKELARQNLTSNCDVIADAIKMTLNYIFFVNLQMLFLHLLSNWTFVEYFEILKDDEIFRSWWKLFRQKYPWILSMLSRWSRAFPTFWSTFELKYQRSHDGSKFYFQTWWRHYRQLQHQCLQAWSNIPGTHVH